MGRWNLKGQVALEFVIILSVVILAFILFTFVILEQQMRLSSVKEEMVVEDIANALQKEVITAAKVNDGYQRSFTMPQKTEGYDYAIQSSKDSFTILTSRKSSTRKIPMIQGVLHKGVNTITKQDGKISIS